MRPAAAPITRAPASAHPAAFLLAVSAPVRPCRWAKPKVAPAALRATRQPRRPTPAIQLTIFSRASPPGPSPRFGVTDTPPGAGAGAGAAFTAATYRSAYIADPSRAAAGGAGWRMTPDRVALGE